MAGYCREETGWLVHTAADGDLGKLVPLLSHTRCDGLISMAAYQADVNSVARLVPHHILVSMRAPEIKLPRVVNDDFMTGRMAADFFLRQGRKNFAFACGGVHGFARLRLGGFSERVKDAGFSQPVELSLGISARALRALPAGIGVLAANDEDASAFCLACAAAGVSVPDRVAVLGVDDDETYCALSQPTLSSITLDTERIGREAASALASLLAGRTLKEWVSHVPPLGVRTRASSGLLEANNPAVLAALRYMEENLQRMIGVDHVASAAGVSRRSLETHFNRTIGHGVYQHLTVMRVKEAQKLLGSGSRLLKEIAAATGFSDERSMKRSFITVTGRPPSAWRFQEE